MAVVIRLVARSQQFLPLGQPAPFIFWIEVNLCRFLFYIHEWNQLILNSTNVVISNLDQGEVYNIMW